MKKIKMLYFAKLQEESGCDSEVVTTGAKLASGLYKELRDRYMFSFEPSVTQVAINQEFMTMDTAIEDGDEVAFIPPVSGG